MKSTILTLTLVMMAALQVACSEDENKGMTQSQVCAKYPQACQNNTLTPASVQALAGQAAVNGNPQVVAALQGKNTLPGQVPNTATLPASIQERAKAVSLTMQAMNENPDFALTNGTRTLVNSNYVPTSVSGGGGSSSGGEITVASVPEQREPAAQQVQAYTAPQAHDPNSVFSQPEAAGAGAAH